jgi:acyl-CoA dehydrogenase
MPDQSYLDWPFFEERHHRLAQDVESFATTQLSDLDLHVEDDETLDATCREIVRRLARADLLKSTCVLTEEDKFDVRSLCLSREILGRHAGIADFAYAMQGLGSGPISLFGTREQRDAYLPGVIAGEKIAAFAPSEPDAGSDLAAMATTATKDGDDYVLNGTKTWISNGGLADQYVVFARTGEAPGAKGLSAFIVEADNPGLAVAERIRVIAPHPLATLTFDNCRVPASAMLGKPGEGFKIAVSTLSIFRCTVGAAALGFARRAMDEAMDRVQKRSVFGQKLVEFQLTQTALADMAIDIDASALLIYRAAWAKDIKGERAVRESSMAKLYGTEAAQRVIDKAVQLFGGLGVVHGMTVEELYREIRALRIYEGTTEIQKLIIADTLLAEAKK